MLEIVIKNIYSNVEPEVVQFRRELTNLNSVI